MNLLSRKVDVIDSILLITQVPVRNEEGHQYGDYGENGCGDCENLDHLIVRC